ncbi:MAG: hypothetical protein K6F46_06835, partial [Desulfovibrio sp.]|nr:hypothetical protein [Desulfovibrio sp.]
RAFDFLNTLKWKGQLPDWQRVTAWPRVNVPLPFGDGMLPENTIPSTVVIAQMELASLIFAGTDLFKPLERGGKIKSKTEKRTGAKVDTLQDESTEISITYADDAPILDFLPPIYALISIWLDVVPGESAKAFDGELRKA